jgi:mono/diheme cytochrome c family protein
MVKAASTVSYTQILIGLILMSVILIAGVLTYLKFGPVPVAVADSPFPFEKQATRIALRARINRENKNPPFDASEDVFRSGANIYQHQCSMCHGTPGHDAALAKHMFPAPPQLWKKHGPHGAVGVSEDSPGFSYWVVSNGIRLTAMPSFNGVLSEKEKWEVSLLLKNADKELPDSVKQTLNTLTP